MDSLRQFSGSLKIGRLIGLWLTFCASIICLTSLVLYVGIEHTEASHKILRGFIKGCQIVFIVNILYNLIFFLKHTTLSNRRLKWIMDVIMLLTLIPLLLPRPEISWLHYPTDILYSRWFIYSILTAYSIIDLSYGIARLLGKKTNPSLILAGSFIFFILIGTLVLMLPKCTHESISFIDSLFVATSAVSITGLTPIDIAQVFTPLGIGVLAVLIQIGALGVLTFTSFFALFFSGETSIYNQLMVRDMIYSKTANSLIPTLVYVFLFTLTIELIGGCLIYFTLPADFPLTETWDKILFSGFQSLSAFCNAGFTWLPDGMGNPVLLNSNQWIYIVMGTLVISGSIGFPILVNFKNILYAYILRFKGVILQRKTSHKIRHLYDINTKIVLVTSLLITVITIILFLLFEWNNTLQGMSVWQKISQAYFNASIPRSSGFASVNPASFMPYTLLLILFLMWIGGSAQSTGGGIKVNTFAAMLLNLRSIVTNKRYIFVYGRTIAVSSIRRANAVIALSLLSYFVLIMTMVLLEPDLPVRDLVFESASALFTVGSSLGITSSLCTASKVVLCIAMFTGRVGLLSLLMGICSGKEENKRLYPYDNIIIN